MKKKTVFIAFILLAVIFTVGFFLYSRQSGYIKVEPPDYSLNLRGGFWGSKTITSSGEPEKIHVGKYRPSYANYFKEHNDDIWQLHCSLDKLPWIKVSKGRIISLKFGPPLIVKADVKRSRDRVTIAPSITGCAGELYSNRVRKNGKSLPAPKLKIVDEAGNVLASGKFEYG
jgi:hypothetical protein